MPNEKQSETVRISKKAFIGGIIVFILVVAGLWSGLSYYPKQQKQHNIQVYKKALFESINCQFHCPLQLVTINGTTQNLPEPQCSQQCIKTLHDKNLSSSTFTTAEILDDGLPAKLDKAMQDCQKIHTLKIQSNATSPLQPTVNVTGFFLCVQTNLDVLKGQYAYLH